MTADMIQEETERAPDNAGVRQALDLINSLIPSTYSTRCFPAKWQSIREKLEQLSSVLAAATARDDEDNSALTELVEAIATTAEDTQLLAQRCSEESYRGGKLQLRSDLDVVSGKLGLHIKHMADISSSIGTLAHSGAIILSRPRAGASREDMRFYVRDLFSRLRVGDREMRALALAAVIEILQEDDKYVKIVATETVDGVLLLVSLLEFNEMGIQDVAAEAVSMIAGFDCYRGALAAAGAVAQLVRVVEAGSLISRERAARALKNLTENSDNAWSVSAHGGVPVLLKISGESQGELVGLACDILRNLSGVAEIRRFMVEEEEEGIVSLLIKLSRSKDELCQIRAIEFLNALASEDDKIKQVIIREGIVESLVQVLDPSSPCSSKARELAIRAIEGFCFSSTNSINILMGTGFLDRLLFFLKNGEISVQESALKAVFRFCGVSEVANKAMGDVGFMPELVKLLEARSFEVREMAAEALCSMVSIQRNRRRFIQEEHVVNRILQLLDPEEEKSVTKNSLLSVLMPLTNSNSGRRKLAASGYVKNLEKLAETGVIDAKKIVKKITSSRFRTILNGIWGS